MREKMTNAPKGRNATALGNAPRMVPTKAHVRNCETQNPQARAMAAFSLGCDNRLNFWLIKLVFMLLNYRKTPRPASRILPDTHHFLPEDFQGKMEASVEPELAMQRMNRDNVPSKNAADLV